MAQARGLHVPEAAGDGALRLALGKGREGCADACAVVDALGRDRLAGTTADVAAFGGGIIPERRDNLLTLQSMIPTTNPVG